MSSVTRSTASTLLLGSMVQPGWGHPELATTTASGVARQARWKYPATSSGVLARPRRRSSSAGIRAGSCQEIAYSCRWREQHRVQAVRLVARPRCLATVSATAAIMSPRRASSRAHDVQEVALAVGAAGEPPLPFGGQHLAQPVLRVDGAVVGQRVGRRSGTGGSWDSRCPGPVWPSAGAPGRGRRAARWASRSYSGSSAARRGDLRTCSPSPSYQAMPQPSPCKRDRAVNAPSPSCRSGPPRRVRAEQ